MQKINVLNIAAVADKALRNAKPVVYKQLFHNGMLHRFATRKEFIEFNASLREHGDRVEA
jgi:hypothetical protein